MFPLLLQFADFCKIASVFAFQIKEWFQFNMLQAHLLVINNIHQKKYWACFGLVFEAAVAYLSRESWQLWSKHASVFWAVSYFLYDREKN